MSFLSDRIYLRLLRDTLLLLRETFLLLRDTFLLLRETFLLLPPPRLLLPRFDFLLDLRAFLALRFFFPPFCFANWAFRLWTSASCSAASWKRPSTTSCAPCAWISLI